ncbi:hypothetical protein DSM112329_05214 [Paraconexibacter sp. AEG42_29]|uniref:RDD domain-containing protein n=1 Tax=Paraconexibacter sp. AEG42_29 TaxID=2997339 RepID=A0AAU7B432_9ACTN
MRFVDLLRTAVLLCGGAASTLAVLCLIGASQDADEKLVVYATAWWLIASILGSYLGRRNEASPPIARLLADSKAATMMPELRPGAVVVNRLWPLLVATLLAGGLAFLAPQIPGIAAGFTILWALTWRRQDQAVVAIEERDGVQFYVERTSPLQPVKLVRVPGLRREVPSLDGVPRP